jgi:hypothetical protein
MSGVKRRIRHHPLPTFLTVILLPRQWRPAVDLLADQRIDGALGSPYRGDIRNAESFAKRSSASRYAHRLTAQYSARFQPK